MGCENICYISVDIVSFHSFRLAILQELGNEGLGHCLSKKAHSNGSDLVVKLGVDCSTEVAICLENS